MGRSNGWWRLASIAALALLILALAGARLVTGPWYVVYAPQGGELLETWPAAWETLYYSDHLPTFLGDETPKLGIAPVQYRTLLNLFLASLIAGWLGTAYWGLALADLALWGAATLAAFCASRRLGGCRAAAAAGAFLTATSPILISNMWRHDLHVANFATLPVGLWAVLTLADEDRRAPRLGVALGTVFLLLSLSYQYQWVLLPVSLVFLRTRSGLPWREALGVAALALLVLAIGTMVVRSGLDMVGLHARGLETTAVKQPGELVAERLRDGGWRTLLPAWPHLEMTLLSYHPIVLLVGVLGLLRRQFTGLLAALAASVVSLMAITLYPAPWTAMSAYPLIYFGAGRVCALAGALIARPFVSPSVARGLEVAVTATLALALACLVNGDLWGDYRFLLTWWRLYFPQAVF